MNSLLNAAGRNFTEDMLEIFNFVKSAFVGFTIVDFIDIILLAALFFTTVKFLKNRKAGSLLGGIVICLIIYALADIFKLSGLRSILSGVFQIGVFALVIIFQPEIRELLEKMGSGSLRGFRSLGDQSRKKQMHYNTIDNICKAVQILSVEKTGALIVIERTIRLDEIIHTGTAINADISDSLLRNLFYNRAPLHDGAVVIQEGRIAAAACILPLPKRTAVDPNLGTRHRAAVGLSEISDAIIIIVSEETGVISVASEAEMRRDFTPDGLRKYLISEILHDAPESDAN